MKRRTLVLFAAAAIAVMAFGAAFFYLDGADAAEAGKEIRFRVERGLSASEIAQNLESAGLVRNADFFLLVSRIVGAANRFQAGTYRIAMGTKATAIVAILAKGRQASVRITVPEGYTTGMIAALLEENGVCAGGDFIRAASDPSLLAELAVPAAHFEGYLFPDTYFFSEGMDAADVVRSMVAAFRAAVEQIPGMGAMDPAKLHDAVVLASIVEREYRVASDAPLIASVFENRLRIGMALQSCATIVYIITERQGKPHPEVVRLADLQIKDMYNTYLHRGLPPGPISNPGSAALAAVSRPAKSDYLYFRLADTEKGMHRFSRTLEEHAQATLSVKGF